MSLTDDWKSGKLKDGWYWVKTECGFIQPVYYLIMRVKGELVKGFAEEPEDRVTEVLAPCDYSRFVELTKEVKYLKSVAAKSAEIAQYASDDNAQLRQLLKECDGCVRCLKAKGVSDCNGIKLKDLLTRINEVLK